MEKIFEIDNLSVHYPLGDKFFTNNKGFIQALNNVSLDIYKNEIFSIVGESGCGKSTFIKTILGLENKTSGTIKFNDKNIENFTKLELKEFRKQCQLVFQNPFSSLNPRMNIFEILKEPLIVSGEKSKLKINEKVINTIKLVGLDENILNRYPHEFSGGQRQRIAIARALILEPKVLIADEPVSALDVSIQAQIINLLIDLKQKLNLTIIFISHDLSVVKFISDRIAVMYLGEIVEIADKKTLFTNPTHPYTNLLLDAVPKININKEKKDFNIYTEIPSITEIQYGCKFNTRCKKALELCKMTNPQFVELSPTHKVACHNIE